ncbi:MAG TPA: DAK2 domain-containing protein [Candidatus Dormibacteraeota bacterium]|nr:DAK2 domain-containing protein [Candidatus Dormibacteraeota bacterium]
MSRRASAPAAAVTPAAISGAGLRHGLQRAVGRLAQQRDRINDLNVFPVPDGDTGTNMHLTLEAALAEASQLPPEAPLSKVSEAAAHGSLMGARGNSGVILSQVLRGVAAGCSGATEMGPDVLARALDEGSKAAYRAVKRPVDGTILSVVRDAAAAADTAAEQDGAGVGEVLQAAVAEAWAAVERSREQLDVLREAGVVDAGGFGLAVILSALAEALGGPEAWPEAALVGLSPLHEREEPETLAMAGMLATTIPHGGFGYCTEFSLVGADLEPLAVRAQLGSEADDDSALVVGDPGLLHIHIHTQEPWQVLTKAAEMGLIERLKVEDMTAQHREARHRAGAGGRDRRLALGVILVAPGFGFHQLLLGLGAAAVVEGGQGMNPSTEDLLRGMEEAQANQIILLPNNPNLVLGAEQAARISRREVAVVPSRNLPQGISALLAFDPEAPIEVNRQRMVRAMTEVHAIEVTEAVRDSTFDQGLVHKGDVIALLDGELVVAGEELHDVVVRALDRLPKGSVEVVTLYRGARVQLDDAERLEQRIRSRFPTLEVERHDGGQAIYPYIISAE